MTGSVAQLIALTAYGNNYIQKKQLPERFYPQNSAFSFCKRVDFREFHKKFLSSQMKEVVVAENPADWLKKLRREGSKRLRLRFQPSNDHPDIKDHKLAGMVGGGGVWLIEAVYTRFSDFWANRWAVTDRDAPDQRIWTVNYALTAPQTASIQKDIDLQANKDQLANTLQEISAFARAHSLNDWAQQFENALALLNDPEPSQSRYYSDILPYENYSLIARQVFAAAAASWVFGGMMSWNDLGFETAETNQQYETLSAQLYAHMIEGLMAAVNSY